MDSSIIGKVDKARKYAEEKERVSINNFSAAFHGIHNTYEVTFDAGTWHCQCLFFSTRGVCSHTMALQRILNEVLARGEQPAEAAV
jgi:hypothetical protein